MSRRICKNGNNIKAILFIKTKQRQFNASRKKDITKHKRVMLSLSATFICKMSELTQEITTISEIGFQLSHLYYITPVDHLWSWIIYMIIISDESSFFENKPYKEHNVFSINSRHVMYHVNYREMKEQL